MHTLSIMFKMNIRENQIGN